MEKKIHAIIIGDEILSGKRQDKHLNYLGISIDFYFANHLNSALSTLFHKDLFFRILDLIFYENSVKKT